jgi:hypothetical protein
MPNFPALLEAGHKKAKLRAHSDRYPNPLVNEYALSFLEYADIMAESKFKNLASIELYNYANTRKNKHGLARSMDVQQETNTSRAEALVVT